MPYFYIKGAYTPTAIPRDLKFWKVDKSVHYNIVTIYMIPTLYHRFHNFPAEITTTNSKTTSFVLATSPAKMPKKA